MPTRERKNSNASRVSGVSLSGSAAIARGSSDGGVWPRSEPDFFEPCVRVVSVALAAITVGTTLKSCARRIGATSIGADRISMRTLFLPDARSSQ